MKSIQRTRVLTLVGILSATCAYACADDEQTTVAPGKDAGGSADGSKTDDGKTDADTKTDAGSGDSAAASTKGGFVSLHQSKPAAAYTTTASAGFYNAPPPVVTRAGCTATVAGGCRVAECDPPVAESDAGTGNDAGATGNDAGTTAAPTAGDVTITGGKLTAEGIVLTPGADGTYAPKAGSTQAFQGGDTLTVKGAGSATGVPAFEGKTLVAPADVVVTPALSTVAPTAVSRTTDFKFNWTGGGSGEIDLVLSTVQADQKSVVITCKAPASAGTVTVPQTAVAKLFATSGTLIGTISVTPSHTSTFTAGDFKVDLTATGNTLLGSLTTN